MTLPVYIVGINVGTYIYAKRLLTHMLTTPLGEKEKKFSSQLEAERDLTPIFHHVGAPIRLHTTFTKLPNS